MESPLLVWKRVLASVAQRSSESAAGGTQGLTFCAKATAGSKPRIRRRDAAMERWRLELPGAGCRRGAPIRGRLGFIGKAAFPLGRRRVFGEAARDYTPPGRAARRRLESSTCAR